MSTTTILAAQTQNAVSGTVVAGGINIGIGLILAILSGWLWWRGSVSTTAVLVLLACGATSGAGIGLFVAKVVGIGAQTAIQTGNTGVETTKKVGMSPYSGTVVITR